jgi:PAS domain S-box-containing protein
MSSPATALGQLFEFAPGYIAMVRGPDHVFEVANAAYRRLVGGRPTLGLPVRSVVPELADQGYIDLLDQVYRTGEPYATREAPVTIGGELHYISFVYQPIKDETGAVTGIFAEGVDVTEATLAQQALSQTERRLEAVLDNASVSIFTMDDRQQCSYMNRAAEELTGFTLEKVLELDKPLHDIIHHTYPDGRPFPLSECAIDRAFPERNRMKGEEIFVHKDGHLYPVAFTASPLQDDASNTVGTIIEVRDTSAEKAAEQRQRLLINELNHRVKNTLAMVQAIAFQTFKNADDPDQARAAFDGRIAALARAHDLLTRRTWASATLRNTVEEALAGYSADPRVTIQGPDLLLPPETAVSLAMAMHELITNAVKFGSLSSPSGAVAIHWTVGDRLRITWDESGGPPVSEPETTGFGSRLVQRGLARDLGGQVTMDFRPQGLVCLVEAPVPVE